MIFSGGQSERWHWQNDGRDALWRLKLATSAVVAVTTSRLRCPQHKKRLDNKLCLF